MPSRLSVARSDIFMVQEALKGRIEAFPNVQPTRVMDLFKTELYQVVLGKVSARESMNRSQVGPANSASGSRRYVRCSYANTVFA